MKTNKRENTKPTESDGLQEAVEKLIRRDEEQRNDLRAKQLRLFEILARQTEKKKT